MVFDGRWGSFRQRSIYSFSMPSAGYSPMYELEFESSVLEIDRQIDGLEENPDRDRFESEIDQLKQTRDEQSSASAASS